MAIKSINAAHTKDDRHLAFNLQTRFDSGNPLVRAHMSCEGMTLDLIDDDLLLVELPEGREFSAEDQLALEDAINKAQASIEAIQRGEENRWRDCLRRLYERTGLPIDGLENAPPSVRWVDNGDDDDDN